MGLARRAGELTYGLEAVKTNISKKNSELILLAGDLSDNSKKDLLNFINGKNIIIITLDETKEEIGYAIGTKPTGIISVNSKNFKKGILEVNLIENKKENI